MNHLFESYRLALIVWMRIQHDETAPTEQRELAWETYVSARDAWINKDRDSRIFEGIAELAMLARGDDTTFN